MSVVRTTPEGIERIGLACTFGHDVAYAALLIFAVDGRPICIDHTFEIADALNSVRDHPQISAVEMTRAAHDRDVRLERDARVSEMRKAGENVAGFVYYVLIDQHIKIGFAADVTKRLRAYPPTAELLAVHPGTRLTEKQTHSQFAAYLDRGREWFTQGKTLMAHIEDVRERFGDPTQFAYRFRHAKKSVNGS